MALDLSFLRDLTSAAGTSGFESRPAAVWRARADAAGAQTTSDAYGNVFATFRPGGRPRVMLAGHIDEIGLIVSYIDDHGFLYVRPVGGWDPMQLVGQRVRVLGHAGDVLGVVGKKAIHLMSAEDRRKTPTMDDLWIDIGATSRQEAEAHVRAGDTAVIEQPFVGGRVKCFDIFREPAPVPEHHAAGIFTTRYELRQTRHRPVGQVQALHLL
ncbi:MAG: hypothetical protein P8Y02_10230, partial [Deinococcales bacterium]